MNNLLSLIVGIVFCIATIIENKQIMNNSISGLFKFVLPISLISTTVLFFVWKYIYQNSNNALFAGLIVNLFILFGVNVGLFISSKQVPNNYQLLAIVLMFASLILINKK